MAHFLIPDTRGIESIIAKSQLIHQSLPYLISMWRMR
jgi:hypothetical protein